MVKNFAILIIIVIILLLVLGGLFYLLRGDFPGFDLLGAFVGSLSRFNDKDVETLKLSLNETKSELEKLQKENYSLKEKLGLEEEIRIELEQKYETEIIGLARKLESLTQMVNDFNRKITQLGVIFGREDGDESEKKDEEINEESEGDAIESAADVCSVNINTASGEELQAIIGIGPVLAQRIIGARPLSSIYDLTKISGIGEATLQKIIDQACAYVEGDKGPSVSAPISFSSSSSGGGGVILSTPIVIVYPKILISEIQIEPIGQRFIELYNPNNKSVDLTGWYIQRKTKGATSWGSLVAKTNFSGKTIPAKSYFLIASSPDFSLDMLIDNLTLTQDNAIVLKSPKGEEVDKIGWGEAPDFEAAPFSENPKTRDIFEEYLDEQGIDYSGVKRIDPFTVFYQSVGRKVIEEENGYNYQDTDNNAKDFEIQTPTPRAKNQSFPQEEFENVLNNFIDYYKVPVGTKIISGPEELTGETQATFKFEGTKEFSRFECRLNDQDWQECESPETYENLTEGEHTFSVRAIDLFLRVDPEPPQYFWVIEILSEEPKDEEPEEEIIFEVSPTSLIFEAAFGETPPESQTIYVTANVDGIIGYYPNWITIIKTEEGNFEVSVDILDPEMNPGYYDGIIQINYNEQLLKEIPVSLKIYQNLLQNWHFDEWEEPADSADYLYNWNYNGTKTHITRHEDGLVENYSVKWSPITTSYNLTQNDIIITKDGTYYAEIWIKPLNVDGNNYVRVALDIADSATGNFPTASFVDYKNEVGWIKLTKAIDNAKVGDKGGIRIRAQRLGSSGTSFLIGAAWLGATEPPENWPQ